MLVLQRHETEEIEIAVAGVTITLKVIRIKTRVSHPEVSLGIDAPPEVKIVRKELLSRPDPKETT